MVGFFHDLKIDLKLMNFFLKSGLRVGMIISALLMAAGTAVRCISMNGEQFFFIY